MTDAALDEWYGVTTDSDGRVTVLDLKVWLTGPIPPELAGLTRLERLLLGQLRVHPLHPVNYLSGPIPPELGTLTRLKELGLQGNELSGGIPAELGNLVRLESLDLSSNQLRSGHPAERADPGRAGQPHHP